MTSLVHRETSWQSLDEGALEAESRRCRSFELHTLGAPPRPSCFRGRFDFRCSPELAPMCCQTSAHRHSYAPSCAFRRSSTNHDLEAHARLVGTRVQPPRHGKFRRPSWALCCCVSIACAPAGVHTADYRTGSSGQTQRKRKTVMAEPTPPLTSHQARDPTGNSATARSYPRNNVFHADIFLQAKPVRAKGSASTIAACWSVTRPLGVLLTPLFGRRSR